MYLLCCDVQRNSALLERSNSNIKNPFGLSNLENSAIVLWASA